MTADIGRLSSEIRERGGFVQPVRAQMERVLVGQEGVVRALLVSVLTQGHILLEGVPGLAKTLAAHSFAKCVRASFQRVQFTPDLLPGDLTGTLVFDQKTGEFHPRKGPLFAHLVLADEINRAPAKVQSALLEAMQERQITIGDTTYPLPEPFLVMATQNPIEQEGTYALPEAQVDRFLLKAKVDYPNRWQEREILDRMASGRPPAVEPVSSPEEILRAGELVREIFIDESLKDYITDLVCATRKPQEYGMDIRHLIACGSSPRGTIALARAAMAHAFLQGRAYVVPEDIRTMAMEALRHRVTPSYEAETEEITPEDIITMIFDGVPAP